VTRVATLVEGGAAYDTTDLTGPVAVVLGSEAHGLPDAVRSLVDQPVSIPMAGRSESLNVAMAGSVLCFEALRQRRAIGGRQPIGEAPA
jgi:TrmH family RNA methyltransferase